MPMTMNGKPRGRYVCSCGFKFMTCGKPIKCPKCHSVGTIILINKQQYEKLKKLKIEN